MEALGTGSYLMEVRGIESFHRPREAHNHLHHQAVHLSELVEQMLSHQYRFPHRPPVKQVCISISALVRNENKENVH